MATAIRSTVFALTMLLASCIPALLNSAALAASPVVEAERKPAAAAVPTATEAEAFLVRVEQELADFSVLEARAGWVNSTYITDDTDALAAYFVALGTGMGVRFALEAAQHLKTEGLSDDTRRKLDIL
ncbi:MAG: hypothetical protein ABW003_08755, partial [Microvirga sp.]